MSSKLSEKLSRLKDSETPLPMVEEDQLDTSSSAVEKVGGVDPSNSNSDMDASVLHEPSPLKEVLLTKFARLHSSTPPINTMNNPQESLVDDSCGILSSDSSPPSHLLDQHSAPTSSTAVDHHSASWLYQVKGRIAKTVEEKYSEYKQEKELRRLQREKEQKQLQQQRVGPFYGESDEQLLDISADDLMGDLAAAASTASLPHSFSESLLTDPSTSLPLDMKGSHSEYFGQQQQQQQRTSSPVIGGEEEVVHNGSPQTPKERRRFTFGFLDRSNRSSPAKPEESNQTITSTTTTSTTTTSTTATTTCETSTSAGTPTKSSLRSRVMGLMGKSPNPPTSLPVPIPEPHVTVRMQELRGSPLGEDPFSGLDLNMSSTSATTPPAMHNLTTGGEESDVETAVEADEMLMFDNPEDADQVMSDSVDAEVIHAEQNSGGQNYFYWWAAGLPVLVVLFLQVLPLPVWIIGFITGILVGIPTAVYATWLVLKDDSPRTPFVENVHRKVAARPAIVVRGELQRVYTWMNLWPSKKGPYDPLTYDVRRTLSVRIMLHGPWVEMRFPKRNLPLRRMFDDMEPKNVEFHEHVEVIDLSTCSIDILPENLPSKRIWSKKYPIRIRTNTRKPFSTPESTQQMAAKTSEDEVEASKDDPEEDETEDTMKDVNDDEEDELMLDAKENLSDEETDVKEEGCEEVKREEELTVDDTVDESSFIVVPDEEANKTFYLFARTGREKEEWFNHFLVAARFMEDWEHQNPKEGVPVDPNYETHKVKEQKFKMFMEDYLQSKDEDDARKKHDETKSSPETMQCAKEQLSFLNIYFARMWHDLHNSKVFIDFLREKITRKLLKVKIAQYFEEVSVTTLDLGQKLPQVLSASLPWQNEHGLWVDLEIEYNGLCQATVETQRIRLPAKDEPDREAAELLGRHAATMDSDEEDSAEEDDEVPENGENDLTCGSPGSPGTGGPVSGSGGDLPPAGGFRARLVEGLLRSDFVAKVAESEWVKKNITGKNITLQLQLHCVKGMLTVNFPPAPSDRIWYGFKEPPKLEIALRPCFGGHTLGKYEGTFSTVMKHLEKRLKQEFIKVLVYPNMDDEVLPFMYHVNYSLTGNAAAKETTPTTQPNNNSSAPPLPTYSSSSSSKPPKQPQQNVVS